MSSNLIKQRIISSSLSSLNKEDWNAVVGENTIFLSVAYLQALEDTVNDVSFIYILSYDAGNKPLFASVFQLATFVYKRNFNFRSYLKPFPKLLQEDGSFKIKLLVCGTVFATGSQSYAFTKHFSKIEGLEESLSCIDEIKNTKYFNKQFSGILYKEFWPDEKGQHTILKSDGYQDFEIDVNMLLPINKNWNTRDDYLNAFKAKFRTKANAALTRSKDLEIRSFNVKDIENYQKDIFRTYKNVIEKSDYSFGSFSTETVVALKKNLGEAFSFKGVLKGGKLIGFSTAFLYGDVLEANYVGLDYAYNRPYAVYETLLYDYVQQAIVANCKELQLGRTSELIKSALGATPVEMALYGKHTKPIINKVATQVLKNITPSDFELRSPFKAEIVKN